MSGDTPADEAKDTPADDIDPDDTPEEKARAATISRTAQLSISQIMAGLEENIPDVPAEETQPPRRTLTTPPTRTTSPTTPSRKSWAAPGSA